MMIESDHQGSVATTPRRFVRKPNGNDFGKDLLRQRTEQAHR